MVIGITEVRLPNNSDLFFLFPRCDSYCWAKRWKTKSTPKCLSNKSQSNAWAWSKDYRKFYWLIYPFTSIKRSIFQTFWKLHCVTKSLLSFSKIGQHWYETFYKGPPFVVFFIFLIYQKFKGGTLIKCLISM